MSNSKSYQIKTFLLQDNLDKPEIRRFNYQVPSSNPYSLFKKNLTEIYNHLGFHLFTTYWKDEEGDDVVISTDEEFTLALTSMKSEVKSFYIKMQLPEATPKQQENKNVHMGVYCDGCDSQYEITGVRYKCGVCDNYDLCSICRESGIHEEHPMYRIPDSSYFSRIYLGRHRGRRHSDNGKKKRRFDKCESGPETGEEGEMHHCKYFHKKCKKAYKCGCRREERGCERDEGEDKTNRIYGIGPFTQIMNDFLDQFSGLHPYGTFQQRQFDAQNSDNHSNQTGTQFPADASYLRNLGSTLRKILDPLGVSVEFEVRNKEENKEEKKNEKEEKKNEKGEKKNEKEEMKNEKEEKKVSSEPQPSASQQKEVRFAVNEQRPDSMMQKIEEITKILSNQTMGNGSGGSNDNDNGWVSFEELKKDLEEPQPSSSGKIPESSKAQPSAPEAKKENEDRVNQNLYPNLTPRVPSNPAVRAALESMLSMGFTNEGNWLTSLLEAKNGDIDQALEALHVQKK